ncbi:MAG TPA: cytochrome c [Gammaproteobacteria bacterium]|nr:cytochrome c [Gammaproteobacteria bacterium]
MKKTVLMIMAATGLAFTAQSAVAAVDGEAIFKKKCKACHSYDKKKLGPAFKDMDKDAKVLRETIINGKKIMPKWGKILSADEVDALVALIKSKQE